MTFDGFRIVGSGLDPQLSGRDRARPPAAGLLAPPVLDEPLVDTHPSEIGSHRVRLESPTTKRGIWEDHRMTFDEATTRLIEIARGNDGVVTAQMVESDNELTSEKLIVSAAAHALAGSTNVFATSGESGWFPYQELHFTDLR